MPKHVYNLREKGQKKGELKGGFSEHPGYIIQYNALFGSHI